MKGKVMEAESQVINTVTSEQVVEDLRTLVRDTEDLLKAGVADTKSRVATKLQASLDRAKETANAVQERATARAKGADSYIRSNPYHAVGIAFGVGFLVCAWLARK
jgi:ElaB/YqjD/DUF883 family membrane-anchored ribosome-binding protein